MFANVKNLRTRYWDVGQGEKIVLLHGWGTQIESLKPIIDHLQQKFNVFVFDFPGFGQTDYPPEAWGLDEYTDWVLCFMEQFNVSPAIVLGHSFGGRIGIKLAALHGDAVSKLILVDSAGVHQFNSSWRSVISRKMSRVLSPALNTLPGGLKNKVRWRLYQLMGATDYLTAGRLKSSYVKVISEDLEQLLPLIQVPTLLIWGEKDTATPLADGKLMAKKIQNSRLEIIRQAGHYPFLDKPEAMNRILTNFLDNSLNA